MTKEKMELYVSPEMEVVEIKSLQILCASPEGFGQGGNYDPSLWN